MYLNCSARFLFGGEQGRLKYAPPDNFSPVYECLLPTQNLCIDPGFYFGELHKVILSGPLPTEDDVAFVPNPVDTTNVSTRHQLNCTKDNQFFWRRALVYGKVETTCLIFL